MNSILNGAYHIGTWSAIQTVLSIKNQKSFPKQQMIAGSRDKQDYGSETLRKVMGQEGREYGRNYEVERHCSFGMS